MGKRIHKKLTKVLVFLFTARKVKRGGEERENVENMKRKILFRWRESWGRFDELQMISDGCQSD
jgi:hypothetical protein